MPASKEPSGKGVAAPASIGDSAGGRGRARALPPERRIELKIQLDTVLRLSEQCSEGLERLSEGTLSRDAFIELLDRQRDAQIAWEAKHRRFLGETPPASEINH